MSEIHYWKYLHVVACIKILSTSADGRTHAIFYWQIKLKQHTAGIMSKPALETKHSTIQEASGFDP